jgi:uncharacterized membrane protein YqaE (UPF0057 family)
MYKKITRTALMLVALATLNAPALAVSLPASTTPATEPNPTEVKAAINELSGLSKKEKKERMKDVKKAVKQYKAEKKAGKEPSTNTLLLVILAILLPPLAVYLHQGEINTKFWISLLLTLLFFIPGVIYALIVILGDGAAKLAMAKE